MTSTFCGLILAAATTVPFGAKGLDADPKNALCEVAAVGSAKSVPDFTRTEPRDFTETEPPYFT